MVWVQEVQEDGQRTLWKEVLKSVMLLDIFTIIGST